MLDLPTEIRGPLTFTTSERGSARIALGVGVGGADASPLVRTLSPGRPWIIVGPHGSGRSTALLTIADGLQRHGLRVLDAPGWLARFGTGVRTGVRAGVRAGEQNHRDRHETDGDLAASDCVLLVDDAEALDAAVGESLVPALAGRCVVATSPSALASTFRGLLGSLREARTVLALGGFVPGDVAAARIPRARPVPGRGLFIEDGEAVAVQVALPP